MNEIGCFICNYNKEKYVVNCVKSLLNQTKKDIDIYVIDNASTDNSVNVLKNEFGDAIIIILNKKI